MNPPEGYGETRVKSKADGMWVSPQSGQFGMVRRMVKETKSGKGLFLFVCLLFGGFFHL